MIDHKEKRRGRRGFQTKMAFGGQESPQPPESSMWEVIMPHFLWPPQKMKDKKNQLQMKGDNWNQWETQ